MGLGLTLNKVPAQLKKSTLKINPKFMLTIKQVDEKKLKFRELKHLLLLVLFKQIDIKSFF
jgi:hypothetical protein